MGFRFRTRIKLTKGLYVNVGKKGISSISARTPIGTLTANKSGTRYSKSLGGGLSYSEQITSTSDKTDILEAPKSNSSLRSRTIAGAILVALGIIFAGILPDSYKSIAGGIFFIGACCLGWRIVLACVGIGSAEMILLTESSISPTFGWAALGVSLGLIVWKIYSLLKKW